MNLFRTSGLKSDEVVNCTGSCSRFLRTANPFFERETKLMFEQLSSSTLLLKFTFANHECFY
jgi:hypothetical protein